MPLPWVKQLLHDIQILGYVARSGVIDPVGSRVESQREAPKGSFVHIFIQLEKYRNADPGKSCVGSFWSSVVAGDVSVV